MADFYALELIRKANGCEKPCEDIGLCACVAEWDGAIPDEEYDRRTWEELHDDWR